MTNLPNAAKREKVLLFAVRSPLRSSVLFA